MIENTVPGQKCSDISWVDTFNYWFKDAKITEKLRLDEIHFKQIEVETLSTYQAIMNLFRP